MEFRIYAEDPRTFLPSPGRITRLELDGPWEWHQWRLDFGYDAGDEVPMFYDPLIGKVIVHAGNRASTLHSHPLDLLRVEGIKTNLPALLAVVQDDRFRSGDYDTGLLGK
jgi:acetyl-CoA carboxylase, biotin carboxylase subunit